MLKESFFTEKITIVNRKAPGAPAGAILFSAEDEEVEMNRMEVIYYAKQALGLSFNTEWITAVRLRHKAVLLPEVDCCGNIRDKSEWVILDMADKIDTGEYGCVYYVGDVDD